MFKEMLSFVSEGYEWIFSGIGVWAISTITTVLAGLFLAKKPLKKLVLNINEGRYKTNVGSITITRISPIVTIVSTPVIALAIFVVVAWNSVEVRETVGEIFELKKSSIDVPADPVPSIEESPIPLAPATNPPYANATPADPCTEPLDKVITVSETLSHGASQGCRFNLWHLGAKVTLLFVSNVDGPVLLEIYDQSHLRAPVARIDEPSTINDGSRRLHRMYWAGGQKGHHYYVKITNYTRGEIEYCLVYGDVETWVCN